MQHVVRDGFTVLVGLSFFASPHRRTPLVWFV